MLTRRQYYNTHDSLGDKNNVKQLYFPRCNDRLTIVQT